MDFEDKLKQFISVLETLKERSHTEEATKHSLVLPFLNMLGYDVFNPLEVVPEYVADIGIKKGEKIDYAILKDDLPAILIECKHHNQPLIVHQNQLIRYFHTTKARIGVLTNGLKYQFFSDLEEPNKMDETPFLEIDLENIKSGQLEELKKFHKDSFDPDHILAGASILKYINKFKSVLALELSNPSEDFVRYFATRVLENKRLTTSVIADFGLIVKKGTSQHISELINNKLKTALSQNEINDLNQEITQPEEPKDLTQSNQLITTEEEMEAFYIIKSICRESIQSNRITFKDTLNYFAILVDNKVTKWIVRLELNSAKTKNLILPNQDKIRLTDIDDLYIYKDLIIESLNNIQT